MITDDHLKILISVIQESCPEGKVIPRLVLFDKFENITNSGMEIYRFKKALSFFIKNGTINGYEIKPGRNGGVYKKQPIERVAITCSSGKFIGNMSRQELSKLMSNLKKHR